MFELFIINKGIYYRNGNILNFRFGTANQLYKFIGKYAAAKNGFPVVWGDTFRKVNQQTISAFLAVFFVYIFKIVNVVINKGKGFGIYLRTKSLFRNTLKPVEIRHSGEFIVIGKTIYGGFGAAIFPQLEKVRGYDSTYRLYFPHIQVGKTFCVLKAFYTQNTAEFPVIFYGTIYNRFSSSEKRE